MSKMTELTEFDIQSTLNWDHNVLEEDSGGHTFLHVLPNPSFNLADIDQFVVDVLKGKNLAYSWKVGHDGERKLTMHRLSSYFDRMNNFIEHSNALPSFNQRYSEYVELFIKCKNKLGLRHATFKFDATPSQGEEFGAESLNLLISTIRNEANTKEFKDLIKARKGNCKRNFDNNVKYVNALFKKYSKLLVLRIDLYYAKNRSLQVTAEDANKDRKRFFNNMRQNSLFEHQVGLIWRLEYRKQRGHHYHLILFFNGQERRKHEWLADEIGKYWCERIVPGAAQFNNCNRDLKRYWNIGIGEIDHSDSAKRNDLLVALGYLTKKDQYLMIRTGNRVMGRMVMPKEKTGGAGRPRTNCL